MTASTLQIAVPAAATVSVAVLSALVAYLANKRERRRALYGEAVRAAVAWEEMLYRIRRRGEAGDRKLIDRFHELQEQQTYYRAWIGSESKYMKRSYDTLVCEIKAATRTLIADAWRDPPRADPRSALPDDEYPAIAGCVDSFLGDVRSHLSPFFWRKLAVTHRNRKSHGS
ncbi:hypothetical protein [Conexibacter woesei]|uniref:hypothetical protein n=1 Tax=Conexibacter woesei TaxID=191495 RepID=UPI0011D19392|nr:hypothetical protein [Conexibacter woesei]